jgi:hypothetical protein
MVMPEWTPESCEMRKVVKQHVDNNCPKWTVFYNINQENNKWVGTGWEFFDEYEEAKQTYTRLILLGHVPTLRAFHESDRSHLGAVHRL